MSSYLNQVSLTSHGLILAAATTKKTSGSSSTTFILLIGIFAIVYFLFLRPRSQRMKRAQQQRQEANVGDEVMLTSGIIGRVTGIEGDRATVEIAPEIEVEVVRRAIGQVLQPVEEDLNLDVPPDPGHDASHEDGYDEDEAGEGHYDDDGDDVHDGAVHDGHVDDTVSGYDAGPAVGHDAGPSVAGEPDGTEPQGIEEHGPGEAAGHLSSDGPGS